MHGGGYSAEKLPEGGGSQADSRKETRPAHRIGEKKRFKEKKVLHGLVRRKVVKQKKKNES